ncbi:MAG: hypothetical protein IPQ07_21920 [Myxococcales bacterium]|nr:hypothetical protein [Myxococcales bacterium]
MKSLWLVVALCAGCNTKRAEEQRSAPTPLGKAPARAPIAESGREITSPLPEKGPHPDYPTAAAAGTDKLFFLEEPDRGPKAPLSYTPPPRTSLTWTTEPYCEVDQLGVVCGKGAVNPGINWRVGRGSGVTIVERVNGGRVDDTTVFTSANGQPAQRLHLDASGELDEALLFTTPGRFSGRDRDGSNALPGCGLFAYVADKQHRLTELRCLQWLGDPMRDTEGVAMRRFRYDARGFMIEETRFGLDGAPAADIDGIQRVVRTRDATGRWNLSQYFDAAGARVDDGSLGCAGKRREWKDGRVVKLVCLDRNDAPVKNSDGITIEDSGYAAEGCLNRTRYFDAAGAVSTNHLGLHGYDYDVDEHCFVRSQTCIGAKGTAIACGPGQPAKFEHTRDAHGRITSTRNFAEDGRPTTDVGYHVHEMRYVHDAAGNVTETGCYDEQGSAVECSATGFHGKRATYDDAGRVLAETFIDTKGAAAANMGVPQRRFRYDNYDHLYEARNLDADGNLLDSAGAAIKHNLYDATHRLFAIQLLDAAGQPAKFSACYTGATCPGTPWHAVRINRRASGAVQSNQFFDADGQLLATIDCRAKPCFED